MRLVIENSGNVRILRLNRPASRNALDTQLCISLLSALDEAEKDDDVRVIVLTGDTSAFCSGADLKEFPQNLEGKESAFRKRAFLLADLQLRVRRINKPLIAAADGPAVGVGASLLLTCDMAIASDGLRFGFPEIRHGILPAMVLAALHEALPRQLAFEMIAFGRLIDADAAAACGLISRKVANDALSSALDLAGNLASSDPRLLQNAKALFTATAEIPFVEAVSMGCSSTLKARGLAVDFPPQNQSSEL